MMVEWTAIATIGAPIILIIGGAIGFYFGNSKTEKIQERFEKYYSEIAKLSDSEIAEILNISPIFRNQSRRYLHVMWYLQICESVYHNVNWAMIRKRHWAKLAEDLRKKYADDSMAIHILDFEGFDPDFVAALKIVHTLRVPDEIDECAGAQ